MLGSAAPRVGMHLAEGWRELVDPAQLEGWRPEPFDLGDGVTEVVTLGSGPAVILLPPIPGFKEAWSWLGFRLATRFKVIAFDFRLFNRRPRWDRLLEDVDRIVAAFAPGPLTLLGHSLGGCLAQEWALRNQSKVSGLVLSSSFASMQSKPSDWYRLFVEQAVALASQRWLPESVASRLAHRGAERARWVYDPYWDESIHAFTRHGIRTMQLKIPIQGVQLAFSHATTERLPGLKSPTLVVVGEREMDWSVRASHHLARLIPEADLRLSPGASHFHPLSRAGWLADTVIAWQRERVGNFVAH